LREERQREEETRLRRTSRIGGEETSLKELLGVVRREVTSLKEGTEERRKGEDRPRVAIGTSEMQVSLSKRKERKERKEKRKKAIDECKRWSLKGRKREKEGRKEGRGERKN
jgi:hypothetical protein